MPTEPTSLEQIERWIESCQDMARGDGMSPPTALRALAALKLMLDEGLDREWIAERKFVGKHRMYYGGDGHTRILAILKGETGGKT